MHRTDDFDVAYVAHVNALSWPECSHYSRGTFNVSLYSNIKIRSKRCGAIPRYAIKQLSIRQMSNETQLGGFDANVCVKHVAAWTGLRLANGIY